MNISFSGSIATDRLPIDPRRSYQSLAHGLHSPTGSGPVTVSALWNASVSSSLAVRRVSVSVTHDALSSPNPTAFVFLARGLDGGPSVSGAPLVPAGLDHMSLPSEAISYVGATDLSMHGPIMAGGVVPASLPNLGLSVTRSVAGSLGGVSVTYELIGAGDVISVPPGGTLVVIIEVGSLISGDPEYAYAVTYRWDETV